MLLLVLSLAFPFTGGTGEEAVVATAESARGANAENVCRVGLGVVGVVCACVVVFVLSLSFPLSYLNFEDEDDDDGVEESYCFLPFSVSTPTASCFIFSFELAAGPGFCDFEDFPGGVRS